MMKGLTLIEVILTMAIVGLVLTSVVAVLDLGLKSWRFQEEKGELLQNGRVAMRRLIDELRYGRAQSVNISAGNIIEFDTVYLIDDDSGVEKITYSFSNNILYRSVDNGTPREVASCLETIQAIYQATGLYEIDLRLNDGNNVLELKNMAHLRN